MKKKLLLILLFFTLVATNLMGVANVPQKAEAASKKSYCLLGYHKGIMGGSNYIKLYLKNNSIVISGKATKYASEDNMYADVGGKTTKLKKKKIKVASNCKIVIWEDISKSYKYKKYLKNAGISPSQDSASICNRIIIKNGKVIKIIFSA